MNLLIQTFPLDGKTLYFVQCPTCKRNKILNSTANVSNVVNEVAFRKLCGCTCKPVEVKQEVMKVKRSGKVLTAVVAGKEYTVKEISEQYGISQATVRQRIRAGKTGDSLIAPTKKATK